MGQIWVRVDPWDKKLVTTALEGGADALVVPAGFSDKVRELGRIPTISEDGDWRLGEDVLVCTVRSQEDEEQILKACQRSRVMVQTTDWTIIPLENLIARGAEVVAQVQCLDEARTAFGILEHGVWGVCIETRDPAELKRILAYLHERQEDVPLSTTEIVDVRPVGMGDRVCVDTCTSMGHGEGMLVGNTSSCLFLIHAESVSNPYVSPRPFRVNAGPVHAYTKVPGGKTRYLSELGAGDPILILDFQGKTHAAVVGRIKIERRPLLLVTASQGQRRFTAIVQNAETIRLVAPDGTPRSVVNLEPGHKVLAAVETGGRHFGHKIEERIVEV